MSATLQKFFIALDTSGSMGTRLTGDSEMQEYCLLDLAKILLLSFIQGVRNDSIVSIFDFSSDVLQIAPATTINDMSRRELDTDLRNANLRPSGSTAMWEVLRAIISEMQDNPEPNSENIIILLTDGIPSRVPSPNLPQGLSDYVQSLDSPPEFTLYSFGLGLGVDSSMLNDLTSRFNGSNVFVSDQGMAGATFVHRLTNIMESRCELPSPELVAISTCFVKNLQSIINHIVIGRYESAASSAKVFEKELTDILINPVQVSSYLEQVLIATNNPQYAATWGIHFLRSLLSAHSRYECHSFIDPSVQSYIDLYPPTWTTERDRFDDIFQKVDTPPPCYPKTRPINGQAPIAFHGLQQACASSVCIHEDSMVLMADGTEIHCKNLQPGDLVATGTGTDKIVCILKGRVTDDTKMVELPSLGGIRLTEWHPICIAGIYQFPFHMSDVIPCDGGTYKYSFILEKRSATMIFNGIEAVTLAHSKTDSIISHSFWGTEAVVDTLRRLAPPEYASGLVVLENPIAVRNTDGEVIDLINDSPDLD